MYDTRTEPTSPERAWSWKEGDARLSVEIRTAHVVWTLVRYDRPHDRFHTTTEHQNIGDFVDHGPFHQAPTDVLEHLRLGVLAHAAERTG